MKYLIVVFLLLLTIPSYAISSDYSDVLVKIEERMMAVDFKGAKEILKTSPIRSDRQLYIDLQHEIDAIADYSEQCQNFFSLASTPGEEASAIANYELLIKAYNFIPDPIHFSEKYVGFINDAYKKAENFVKKECGEDYDRIRVGMTLFHVQKCVGEFFLHGQVKGKHGTVDYYTRGGIRLYVKKGKVVAWDQ